MTPGQKVLMAGFSILILGIGAMIVTGKGNILEWLQDGYRQTQQAEQGKNVVACCSIKTPDGIHRSCAPGTCPQGFELLSEHPSTAACQASCFQGDAPAKQTGGLRRRYICCSNPQHGTYCAEDSCLPKDGKTAEFLTQQECLSGCFGVR